MRITDIDVATAPIASTMSNAVIDFSTMTVSVLAVTSDLVRDGEPLVGYGFHSNGRYAQSGILTDRLLPRLRRAPAADLLDPLTGVVDPVAAGWIVRQGEKPGGHGDRAVACGALDMALWDLAAKARDLPLVRLLHERFRLLPEPRESVQVYAAGGYYHPGKDLEALRREIRGYLDLGYRDAKIKIGGASIGEDLERIESVLELLPAGGRLAVDANGRFDLVTSLAYADALEGHDLLWYEEPCDPLDYRHHAVLAEHYPGALATGENLLSMPDARNLLRHAGLRPDRDILQMDPSLSYGIGEFVEILGDLDRHGWSAGSCHPHGGHQYNLAAAAAFGLGGCESYPGVFEPFGGFAETTPVVDGWVRLPDAPGIGIEQKPELSNAIRQLF